ncbi:MAG: TrkH family potassium uptake protein [Thermoleophilia bacterium]
MRGLLTTRSIGHPAQLVVGGFATIILVGTAVLMLPFATTAPGNAPFATAFFSSTAAVTLSGMAITDMATYWTPAGQATILVLIQVGGIGIVTSASLLFLVVARRVGLRGRLATQTELHTVDLGSTKRLLVAIVGFSLVFQAVTVVTLTLRLWLGAERDFGEAAWNGLFHGVAAFNNAGLSIFPGGMTDFAGDPGILVPVMLAVIAGGLGFPVWLELQRRARTPRRWSLHTKITLTTTAALLVFGIGLVTALEWANPLTLGGMSDGDRLLAGAFSGVMPRTAGFNVIDYAQVEPDTLLVTEMLMFAGGGSGSVAGGIKVTTFALLFLIVWAEMRGDPEVTAFRRRIPATLQRQALTIAVIAVNAVVVGALAVMASNEIAFSDALFECVAAFTTAGLSTGVTADLNPFGQSVLILLMFLGRVGPLTLGVALVLRERERLYSYPDERPLVG